MNVTENSLNWNRKVRATLYDFFPSYSSFKLQIIFQCSKFLKKTITSLFSPAFLRLKWKYILRATPYRNEWFSLLSLHRGGWTGRKCFHKLDRLMHFKVFWNLPSINNVLLSIVWRILVTGKQAGYSLNHLGEINWQLLFYVVPKNLSSENSNIWMYLAQKTDLLLCLIADSVSQWKNPEVLPFIVYWYIEDTFSP